MSDQLPSRQWFRDHAGVMLNDTDAEGMEEWAIVAAWVSGRLVDRDTIDWDSLDWVAAEAVLALSSHRTPTRPYIEAAFKAAFGLEWDEKRAALGVSNE